MSEALSRIQIEQFQRRKEAAAVNEKLTELNHDLEQHVAETEKTKETSVILFVFSLFKT